MQYSLIFLHIQSRRMLDMGHTSCVCYAVTSL